MKTVFPNGVLCFSVSSPLRDEMKSIGGKISVLFASIMKLRQLLDPIFLYRNGGHFIRRLDERRDHFTNNWKLRSLQNRHCGGRCFIIGNGPSLTMTDLEQLRDEVTFASNKIYLAFKMTSWRPTYYVLEDNHMIEQHHEEIRHHLSCPKFVTDQWRHLFRGQRRVIWYPRRYAKENEFPRFSDNACDAVYCGYMVTYISLQLAYFMGFTQVYLIGVDFNYSLNSLRSELYCARRGSSAGSFRARLFQTWGNAIFAAIGSRQKRDALR
jgi:hypothetical protein